MTGKEQWFWEQCGFHQETDNRKGYHWELGFRYHDWLTPNGETSHGSNFGLKGQLPPIDLNSLFKYAVPLLEKKLGYKEAYKLLIRWTTEIMEGKDPADSLFEILYIALGGK
ncbi:MAG: hypothetical protein KAS32_21105 [Candidatus Peribacteraceae bacterium]|nr:hypothetical protein [Candidatus Peribacteraceae bacterium]